MPPSAREQASNANARAVWLAQGLRGARPLPGTTGQLGSTIRIKLDPVGLMTSLIVRVTLRVDIAGAIGIPGNSAPYNVVTRLRLTDTSTQDRIVIGGDHAYAIQAISDRASGLGQGGLIYSYPKMPTAIGTDQLIDVSYRLNVCGDPRFDLRGAMYMPNEPNAYLFVDLAPQLLVANDDSAVYKQTSGSVTVNTSTQQPTVEVWQEFIDGPYPLPVLDLATKHYLTGTQQITNGLQANTEQLIDYPTARRIRRFLFSQQVDNQQAVGNLALIRSVVRSNYDSLRMSGVERFVEQRRTLNGNDLQQGFWFIEHAPEVASAFAREYQAGITPAVTGASQNLVYTFETFGS